MLRPAGATLIFLLQSLEVFSVKGHKRDLGRSDMIPCSHGVMEYWINGVMGKDERDFVLFLAHYFSTPTLQSLRDSFP